MKKRKTRKLWRVPVGKRDLDHAGFDHVKADELLSRIKSIDGGQIINIEEAAFAAWVKVTTSTTSFSNRRPRIARPPGARLHGIASFVFSKRIYQTVLKPCLADTQEEYFEALSEGKTRKAQWVRIRGIAGFWWTVWLQLPVSLARTVKKLWTISGG